MSVDLIHLEGAPILRKTSSTKGIATWGDIIEQGVHHPLLYCVKTPGETWSAVHTDTSDNLVHHWPLP